jgi:hypothetical protein
LIDRRTFIKGSFAAGALAAGGTALACGEAPAPPPDDGWRSGDLLHLLPTADHERIRIKASFARPRMRTPWLHVGSRRTPGRQSDSDARFFCFDIAGLAPATTHTLRLHEEDGAAICDAWPLRTFPAPDAAPQHFRLLAFTCAGGPEDLYNFGFFNAYLPHALRQRLFARALSFAPDAAIANGDHVYWDLQSKFGWAMGRSPRAWWNAGFFDREQPVLGTKNEGVLQRAFGPQIAGLYGVRFRSTPSFFLQDDHDYGENDEASDALRTFPADDFMIDLARTTQRLYYPELLVASAAPVPYMRKATDAGPVGESFGALRYGRLFEALLYDCRRQLRNASDPRTGHAESGFVSPEVERWIAERVAGSDAAHLAQMPSTPVLWTAGKWGEWYPDVLGDGKDDHAQLRIDVPKPYWPRGWNEQHDRLVGASCARDDRLPLFVSGDLHAIAAGHIHASNGGRLANPLLSILCGPIGTGALGWPSKFRGTPPLPSGTLVAEESIAPLEENGFSLFDFTPDEMRVSFFRWTPDQPAQAIDHLEPFETLVFPRPGS